jgi:class 3 adenylate cyclase
LTSIDGIAASVDDSPPDLAPAIAPDGTVTILFSDIAGSTALNERLGDERWMERLHEHNAHVREQLAAHGGYEVKNQGDGFMLAFGSALDGLRCAIAIQRALSAVEASDRLAVRIGLHTGEAIHEDDDYFGKDVALAARIGNAAFADQILVSDVVHSLTEANDAFQFDRGQEIALKGLEGTHRVYSVWWHGDNVST